MNFSELETLMSSRGVTTLAEIARTLNTTPQAVSNWKSRDQVPHHIAGKLMASVPTEKAHGNIKADFTNKDQISFSDILLTISEHLKVAVLVPFIVIFLTFTYVQFIKIPQYESWASVLLPEDAGTPGGLAGLASSFGINIPIAAKADLSSPTLFPELMASRTFAEIILQKKFDLIILAIFSFIFSAIAYIFIFLVILYQERCNNAISSLFFSFNHIWQNSFNYIKIRI